MISTELIPPEELPLEEETAEHTLTEKPVILIVEDNDDILEMLKEIFHPIYEVHTAGNGKEGFEQALTIQPDIVLSDVMMPEMSGKEMCYKIKNTVNLSHIPVVLLTAQTSVEYTIEGYMYEADDYITKPFNPLELVARVKSQLRRYTQLGNMNNQMGNHVFKCGGLQINDENKEVTVDGELIEYNILLLLVKNAGKVFSIDQIYEAIWNEEAIGADNTVAVHIRHIREKIEINPREPRYLKVVWGVGYKIEKQ